MKIVTFEKVCLWPVSHLFPNNPRSIIARKTTIIIVVKLLNIFVYEPSFTMTF